MPRQHAISRTQALLLVLTPWTALLLFWSWYLVSHAYQRYVEEALADRAQSLAIAIALSPESPADRPLNTALALDSSLAYAMVWSEDGHVLRHSRPELVDTYLDPKLWPALDPSVASRISFFSTTIAPGVTMAVVEATVPFYHQGSAATHEGDGRGGGRDGGGGRRTFLSLASRRPVIDAQYHGAVWPLLLATLFVALVGGTFLAMAVFIAFRRLEQSRREIEQNARARTSLLTERGMLASVLAHEVRSPLTALRFNLHTLRGLLADESRKTELTDRCEREIERLDRMLNDFLMRTQVITAPDAAGGTSINAVIREAMDFLAPALERRHIRVSLHLDTTDPRVPVQPDELRQVILNLAANAQDAMPPPKGGTLAISTVLSSSGSAGGPTDTPSEQSAPLPQDATVTLLIRDSGVGIPPELFERIFEPFFSTKPNGSGLGLTLVRRVISGAGGSVFCESAPPPGGQGTTFRILLPAARTATV